jgi:hypothetical protein
LCTFFYYGRQLRRGVRVLVYYGRQLGRGVRVLFLLWSTVKMRCSCTFFYYGRQLRQGVRVCFDGLYSRCVKYHFTEESRNQSDVVEI